MISADAFAKVLIEHADDTPAAPERAGEPTTPKPRAAPREGAARPVSRGGSTRQVNSPRAAAASPRGGGASGGATPPRLRGSDGPVAATAPVVRGSSKATKPEPVAVHVASIDLSRPPPQRVI